MPPTSLHDLRRVAESLALLKGCTIEDSILRSDFRQLRIELSEGLMLVVALETDESGKARLEVDVVKQPEEPDRNQLEVVF